MAREAEMVHGTWMKYFYKTLNPVFDDVSCGYYEQWVRRIFGDFFERNLQKEAGPLLSLGCGFGQIEIPLARRGYVVKGLDNDQDIVDIFNRNAGYGFGRASADIGDLYDDFEVTYLGSGVQACISFGVMEHFTREDLDRIIEKQFRISPLLVMMVPVNTPETLEAFGAVDKPEAHLDENGIYRNFWTRDHWVYDIFGEYDVVECRDTSNTVSWGTVDGVILSARQG